MNVNTAARIFMVTSVSAEADSSGKHEVVLSFGEKRHRFRCTPANRPTEGQELKIFYQEGELDFRFEGLEGRYNPEGD